MAVGPPPKASKKGSPPLVSCSAALSNFEAKISKASPVLSMGFVAAAKLSSCSSGLYASLAGNSAPGIGLVAVTSPVGPPKSPSKSEANGPLGSLVATVISVLAKKDCVLGVCMDVVKGVAAASTVPNGPEVVVVSATEKNADSEVAVVAGSCSWSLVANNSAVDDCIVSEITGDSVAKSKSMPAFSVSLPITPVIEAMEALFSLVIDAVSAKSDLKPSSA